MLNPVTELQRFERIINDGNGIVLLHRLLSDEHYGRSFASLPDMEIPVGTLERFICWCKSKSISFVSLDEMVSCKFTQISVQKVALTFDDGYIDNFDLLLPILKKHNVPACIFVVVDYLDNKSFHYWGILEDFVSKKEEIQFHFNGKQYRYNTSTHALKRDAMFSLDEMVSANFSDCSEILKFFELLEIPDSLIYKERTLSWDHLYRLAKDELITIGSHTISHPVLTNLSDSKVLEQLQQSKSTLEKNLKYSIDYFTYPYGKYNEKVKQLVKKVGYKYAFITESKIGIKFDPFEISRTWISGDGSIVKPIPE